MMAVMAFAPIGLAGCGVGFPATVGAVAWHLVAMYAPALALGLSVERLGAPTVAGAGLGLVGLAVVGIGFSPGQAAIMLALIAAGAGWSLATSAALLDAPPQSSDAFRDGRARCVHSVGRNRRRDGRGTAILIPA